MPVRKLKMYGDFVASEMQMVEKWPIIQAYGLDMVGGGFFTMKHQWVNIRDELTIIYKEYDSFSKYRIVNEEIERLNVHYFDNFFNINRDTAQKRQQRTEQELIDAFDARTQYGLLQKKSSDFAPEDSNDGLPATRVLIGKNTGKDYSATSDSEMRLYKFNYEEEKYGALHFTCEFVEKCTNMRFARTCFLTNLSEDYMQSCYFS